MVSRVGRARALALAVVAMATMAGSNATAGQTADQTAGPPDPGGARAVRRPVAPLTFEVDAGDLSVRHRRDALRRALADWAGTPTADGKIDLRALGRLARAAVLTIGGIELPDPARARDETAARAADHGGGLHLVQAAGDLDGDGLDDVLDYALTEGGAAAVARDGETGDALWELPFTGIDALVIPAGDATGDGAEDLAVIELFLDEGAATADCTPFNACYGAAGETFHWVTSLRNGTDGAVRWTRRTDGVLAGAVADSFGETSFAVGGAVAALNGIIALFPSDDHDGDGARDLVWDEIDVVDVLAIGGTFSEQASAVALAGGLATATRAAVLSGSSGEAIFTKVAASPGLAYLAPGVDTVGSPVADLIWDDERVVPPAAACAFIASLPEQCVGVDEGARAVELLDGETLATAWTADLGGPGFLAPAGGDANGDGSADLMFFPFFGDAETWMLDGATGSILWRSPDYVLGVVGAVGEVPYVLAAIPDDEIFDGFEYEMRRRDGRDGSLISARRHHVDLPTNVFDIFIFAELWLTGDAEGDGLPDALSQVSVFATETDVYLAVERGTDAADILVRQTHGARFAYPVGDMDSDGLEDLLDITDVVHRRSTDLRFAGLRLPSGSEAWSFERRLFPEAFVFLALARDLTGAGGPDLLLSWAQATPDGEPESLVQALEQSDGTDAWTLGGPLSAPPPPAPGGIAGRLTGDGEPFFGACVSAQTPDGFEVAFTLALGDGSYALPELDDGDYVVWLGDCFFGSRAPEYYDDVADIAEATVITVAGSVVTGIDADLAPAA